MDRRTPTARHQHRFLEDAYELGLYTDASLAARLAELGEPVDRSTLVRYRSGDRAAPLGLLPILLGHVEDPAAILDLLARPLGLRVVPDTDPASDDRGLADRALELGDLVGDVHRSVRQALADGVVTEEERAAIHATAELAARRIAELAAITAPGRRGAA